ncbi:hypothetical protein [Streptomyces sp. NPDC048172]|uniref:hypothetical protein n=1 Tax=Streptomyces sp. NPDC048172 TaxID=3365505 RepID=UPI003718F686
MLRTSYRKTALATVALLASTALLTACQDSGGDSDGKKSGGSSSSDSSNASKEQSGGGGGDAQARSGKGGKKGVNGTWFGNVEYLAPGKYTVSDMKGTKQQFFTSTDTNIQGAGKICGDANGQAATKCTEAQLEAASKKGVSAKVQIKDGIAVSVVEDHSSSGGSGGNGGTGGSGNGGSTGGGNGGGGKKGVNGTWFGNVAYLAPGKYTVSDMKGVEQQFFTSTDTDIQGAGEICGDAEGQAATKCTEAELEAASKKGVSAKVQIKDGIAVSIVEDHS